MGTEIEAGVVCATCRQPMREGQEAVTRYPGHLAHAIDRWMHDKGAVGCLKEAEGRPEYRAVVFTLVHKMLSDRAGSYEETDEEVYAVLNAFGKFEGD